MKDCYTTKRLLLRPASISMAAALADYYQRNEAFLRPFDSLICMNCKIVPQYFYKIIFA